MAWDHPNAKPLRVQILEDIVLHSTPSGCVADTPETSKRLRLVKPEPPQEAA